MDLEILKKQNKLTINDDGLIYIKPIDNTHYITHPLKNLSGCIAITPEDYLLLRANYYKFDETLTKLEVND